MFKVFISASSLEKMCLDEMDKNWEQQSSWFLILSKQKVVYLDKNIGLQWSESDDFFNDPLYIFSESYGIELQQAEIDFNKSSKEKSSVFLNEPQGAFLLDVDKETAESIQRQYGIICQSTSNLASCPLDLEEEKIPLRKGKKSKSWQEIFANVKEVPSNALIIIDRYIFSNDGVTDIQDGINNIKNIIKGIIPDHLSCDYHILILFDSFCSQEGYNLENLAEALDAFKRIELNRDFNIIIELYSITNQCFNYDITHNRKIISNYYKVFADHLFKAFLPSGNASCTQNIRIERAYSFGLHKDGEDATIIEIQNDLKDLKLLHKEALKHIKVRSDIADDYEAICDADKDSDVPDIRNRLIVV